MSSERADRNQLIVELRGNGWTFVAIGKMFDIDSTAARNIWERETEKRGTHSGPEMWTRPCLGCGKTVTIERKMFQCEPCRRRHDAYL